MKRVRLRSMADFENLPEDEWVEVVGGMNVISTFRGFRVEDDSLFIDLPENVRKAFGGRPRDELKARISKGTLIVTRTQEPKPKRKA